MSVYVCKLPVTSGRAFFAASLSASLASAFAACARAFRASLADSQPSCVSTSPRWLMAMNTLPPLVLGVFSYSHEWKYRSEEHTSELQSLMRISYAVFCLKKKKKKSQHTKHQYITLAYKTSRHTNITKLHRLDQRL